MLQLGWDEKSRKKIDQMLAMDLPEIIACGVDVAEAEKLANVEHGCGGIFYPQGGWLSPAELTTAMLAHGETQGLRIHWLHRVSALSRKDDHWTLTFSDRPAVRHPTVVLANGHAIADFAQSAPLPTYPVAGQVSHVPSTPGLNALQTVLCYDGYLTPVSPQFGTHCIGASYHRGDTATAYREEDQQENRSRLLHCLPDSSWAETVDVSDGEARMGCAAPPGITCRWWAACRIMLLRWRSMLIYRHSRRQAAISLTHPILRACICLGRWDRAACAVRRWRPKYWQLSWRASRSLWMPVPWQHSIRIVTG